LFIAPLDPLAVFRGPTSKGGKGRVRAEEGLEIGREEKPRREERGEGGSGGKGRTP